MRRIITNHYARTGVSEHFSSGESDEIGEAAGSPTGSTETRRVFRYRVNWRQYLCRSIFGLPAVSRIGISLDGEAFAALLAPTAHPLVSESRIR
jgi:hypothetical protein